MVKAKNKHANFACLFFYLKPHILLFDINLNYICKQLLQKGNFLLLKNFIYM